ncbi:uncharacterized protein [Argopecten irradians]|uniref:uncharacterized protein n=1 Tax=Argopecten irradians TaxID=31199 RepID=UPI00371FCF56
MVKTKTTPRKEQRCPMCTFTCTDMDFMKTHIVQCGMREMEKKSFICDICQFATTSTSNLLRHAKRRHSTEQAGPSADKDDQQSDIDDEESWRDNDPGDLSSIIGNVSDSDVECNEEPSVPKVQNAPANPDPTVRKRTRPDHVFAPKRDAEKFGPKDPKNCVSQKVPRIDRPPANVHQTRKPTVTTSRSVHVQTSSVVQRQVVWKTTKYTEGERDIEIVEMTETESFCGVCGAKN